MKSRDYRTVYLAQVCIGKMLRASEPFTIPQVTRGIDLALLPTVTPRCLEYLIQALVDNGSLHLDKSISNRPLYSVTEAGRPFLQALYEPRAKDRKRVNVELFHLTQKTQEGGFDEEV